MSILPDGPFVVKLSDEERETGNLTPLNMLESIDAFFRDGLVVIENAVEIGCIDRLNERMKMDTEELLKNESKIHWKQVIAHRSRCVLRSRADASLFESARDEQEAMFHRTHPSRKVKLDRENSGHKADCFPVMGEQNTCTHRSTRIVLPAPSWPTSSDLAHRFVTSVPTPWSATLPVVRMSTKSLLPLPPWSLTR